ncbi:MAG: hypothetical protein R3297_01140 [Desulfobulbales bacterium]|nr:hypothetical protein [Desulfobulbales bacterium]
MKKAVLDASSAILLLKAALLDKLVEVYHVSQAQSVLHELTRKRSYGTDAFLQYAAQKKIKIIDVQHMELPLKNAARIPDFLGQGELDTIKCFWAGKQNFIIIDDGRAARYCSKNNIDYINALLFPRLLYFSGSVSLDSCNYLMDKIIKFGRYSGKIAAWARDCKKEDLLFAIPGSEYSS